MKRVFVGLGGNLGDREKNLASAVRQLERAPGIEVVTLSPLFETEPVGFADQPWFLNQVVEILTTLEPYEVLKVCQTIENRLKRVRPFKNAPRTIDLDILLYEDVQSKDERLTLPHPRMTERAFVLAPLAAIAPDLEIGGQTVRELLAKNQEPGEVRPYQPGAPAQEAS